jgi:hypothetical protein
MGFGSHVLSFEDLEKKKKENLRKEMVLVPFIKRIGTRIFTGGNAIAYAFAQIASHSLTG